MQNLQIDGGSTFCASAKRSAGKHRLTLPKMKGHPRMLLKINDHRKFSWGYPRMLFKIRCLAVPTHYLTDNKWLDDTRWEIAA